VLGCTFYSNSAVSGGAIYNSGGTVTVTGNIFYGNTATSGNVVYGTATSGGYNVSDKAAGADGSGYAAADDDKFSVTELPISPDDFKPVEDGGAAGLLPDSLPEGYPALDFYGEPVAAGGQAGAAQDLSAAASGFYLTYNVNNDAYGKVELTAGTADEDGSYTSGASVTLNATAKEIAGYTVSFSHWTVNGTEAGSTNPFTFTMDADKVVQAVFSATPLGTAPIELAFDDGGTLISGNTENLTVDKSEGQPLTVTAAAGLTAIQWSLNGVEIPAPRGTEKTITINAANYPAGKYLLGLAAKKDGVDYSAVVTFTVVE
jgi:hypothetical protein